MPDTAGPRERSLPPFEGTVGAIAGLVAWLGTAVVSLATRGDALVTTEPTFWTLASLPIGLGALGWLVGTRRLSADDRFEVHRAETERAMQELQTREWVTRSVLQNAFDAVLILDLEGRVLDANPPAAWVFGMPLETLVRQPIANLLPDHDHLDQANVVERRSAEGERLGVEWRTRARHADGSVFAVDLHTALLKQPRVRVFTLREASTRMRREDRLVREALDASRDRGVLDQRRRGLLLQIVSNGMRSLVDLQLSVLGPPGAAVDAREALLETTHGLLIHVEQVSNLMMWERSAASPTVGPVEVRAVLDEVATDVASVAVRNRNRLVCTVASDIDEIVADTSLLGCALRNLLLHALRRLSDGTVRVDCVREPGRGTDWITVFVEDDGPALGPDQRDAIQAAFEVSADPTPPPDARAGLALAQRLARALGGHVGVESRDGGTALSLRIPIEPTKVKDVPSRPVSRMDSPLPVDTFE